jgi:hypothetical protein
MLRCSLSAIAVIIAFAGCAASTQAPAKIEGRIDAISAKDVQEITALIHHDMIREFGRPVPIDRLTVHDHNYVIAYYQHGNDTYSFPLQRERGVWTGPRVMVW